MNTTHLNSIEESKSKQIYLDENDVKIHVSDQIRRKQNQNWTTLLEIPSQLNEFGSLLSRLTLYDLFTLYPTQIWYHIEYKHINYLWP